MPFDDFLGNPRVIERLRTKLNENRFPHAVIFAGPDGVGKRTCALMVAKAFNCAQGSGDHFCGVCSQCRKIDAGTHPDIISIGVEADASEIKIAQIRQLLQTLGLRPMEGSAKVFIIDPANQMKASAANALLKGLEEPPENSYFILLTNNQQELLPTVRSRCQSYHFTPLTLDQLRAFGSDELLLRWSRGSIGTLRTLDITLLRQRREVVLDFIETAARSKESEFRDVLSASGDVSRSKNDFESHLEIAVILVGDILYLKEGRADNVVNIDLRERLTALAEQLSTDQIVQMGDFLRIMETNVKGYVNRQMLTDVLALTVNESLAKIAHDNAPKSR